MKVGNWTKLAAIILVLISVSLLGALKIIDGETCAVIIMGVLGYVFGNSHGAIENKTDIQKAITTYENNKKTGDG